MKKLLLITLLAICTACFAGCNSDKANGNGSAPQSIQKNVQSEPEEPEQDNGERLEDVNELPVPPRQRQGREHEPRRDREQPEPCPMPRRHR